MELQLVGSPEVGSLGDQHLRWWDMIPNAALVPWLCCLALPVLPRSTVGFPGTQPSPFAESKQPLKSGCCVCSPCLTCGLSTSSDTLSQHLGTQTGGQCPDLVLALGAHHMFPAWLGIFQGRFCCLFPSADPPRNSPQTACASPVVLSRVRGFWVVFGSC